MAQDSPIIANLPAVTLNWVSPVRVDESQESSGRGEHEVTTLLQSSPESWLRADLNIQPDPAVYPEFGFPAGDERAAQPLAVSILGSFDSYFAGKEVPQPTAADPAAAASPTITRTSSTIEQSPATARLVVIGSGDFLNDDVFNISSQLAMDRYLNSLQLIQNTVDWAVEDLDLLNIRSRGSYARVLEPLTPSDQSTWEYANYGFALLALLAIGLWWATRRRAEQPMQLTGSSVETTDQVVSSQ
jgi:ABC-2 type transport system permease protein